MTYHKLRIAWSVSCGLAVILLIALWVRSYWRVDGITAMIGVYNIQVASRKGCIRFDAENWRYLAAHTPWQYFGSRTDWVPNRHTFAFEYSSAGHLRATAPHWFVLLIVGTLGVVTTIPWIRERNWQFSLRTLLIATTLVAAALGLVVWSAMS